MGSRTLGLELVGQSWASGSWVSGCAVQTFTVCMLMQRRTTTKTHAEMSNRHLETLNPKPYGLHSC